MFKKRPEQKVWRAKKHSSGLQLTEDVQNIIAKKNRDYWGFNGENGRLQKHLKALFNRPIDFLKKLGKQKPTILILGAGKGNDLPLFYNTLRKSNLFPQIDVFGLTQILSYNARFVVQQDLSQNLALETLGSRPEQNIKLATDTYRKYDLIMVPTSAGFHTKYAAHNCFFTALMLAPDGEAYLQVSRLRHLFLRNKFLEYPYDKYISAVFARMLKIFNERYKTDLNFELEFMPFGSEQESLYLRIKRIN